MGLLDRYGQFGQYGRTQRIDPLTGMPLGAPLQQPVQAGQPERQPKPIQPPMPGQPAAPLPPPQPFGGAPMQMFGAESMPPDPAPEKFEVEKQPQPGDVATGVKKKGGLLSRVGQFANDITSDREDGFNRTDLMQLGLSLLGNAESGGGGWGGVSEDFAGIQQGITGRQDRSREIKRQETSDSREGEQFEAWRKEQERTKGLTDRYNAELEDPTLDEESKRMLGIMGPEGFGQYQLWKAEQAARAEETESNREFTAGENEKDRNSRMAEARLRAANENSFGRYFQAMDAETIGKANTEAAQIQTRGLPLLQTIKDNITRVGNDGTGKPIGYDTRITLGRWFNGSSAERQSLETWKARVMQPALETLRNLGAMSEREMITAMDSFANPNMTLGSALELIDERINLAERKVLENSAMNDFFTESGGITGKRNKAGQDWATYLKTRFDEADQASAKEPAPEPEEGLSELPPPASYPEGHVLIDQDTGQKMKRVGNQWVPVGRSQPKALSPPTRKTAGMKSVDDR